MKSIKDYAEGKNTLAELIQKYQSDSLNVKNNYALAQKHTARHELNDFDFYVFTQ